jgi:glutaminyl-peptide cyclotransferase
MGIQSTELSGVEHLILLDLLGAPQPSIRSYFSDTTWLFDAMVSAESRLGKSGAFAYSDEKGMEPGQWKSYFSRRTTSFFGYIGDDHVPFLQKGVSVLHIIPEPFPRVWHKLTVGHL